jgi:hypothetical protein
MGAPSSFQNCSPHLLHSSLKLSSNSRPHLGHTTRVSSLLSNTQASMPSSHSGQGPNDISLCSARSVKSSSSREQAETYFRLVQESPGRGHPNHRWGRLISLRWKRGSSLTCCQTLAFVISPSLVRFFGGIVVQDKKTLILRATRDLACSTVVNGKTLFKSRSCLR